MSDFLTELVDKHTDKLNKYGVLALILFIAFVGCFIGIKRMPQGYPMVPTATQPGFGDYRNTIQRNS